METHTILLLAMLAAGSCALLFMSYKLIALRSPHKEKRREAELRQAIREKTKDHSPDPHDAKFCWRPTSEGLSVEELTFDDYESYVREFENTEERNAK